MLQFRTCPSFKHFGIEISFICMRMNDQYIVRYAYDVDVRDMRIYIIIVWLDLIIIIIDVIEGYI
jgi:hypothetical protein